MKESPIIFNGEMVKAILEGRKTQTRRVITESYKMPDGSYAMPKSRYGQVGNRLWVRETFHATDRGHKVHYKAKSDEPDWMKWSPSIHMPRWASRINLEITAIRVERLQEITDEDAVKEGQFPTVKAWAGDSAKYRYASLWDSLNAKRGYNWDSNPFVWVISFKPI